MDLDTKEVLKVIYPIVLNKLDYLDQAKDELGLLGINVEDDQILFVGSCVVGTKDIGAAEAKLNVADINSIQSVAAAERDRIANEQDRQSEVLKEAQIKEDLEKSRELENEKLAILIGQEVKKAIKDASKNQKGPVYTDYMAAMGMGETPKGMYMDVKKLLTAGWEPIGGISVTLSPSGKMLFAQAMGKRK